MVGCCGLTPLLGFAPSLRVRDEYPCERVRRRVSVQRPEAGDGLLESLGDFDLRGGFAGQDVRSTSPVRVFAQTHRIHAEAIT